VKIGINAWAFPKGCSVPQGFKLAKSAGFDCVELNVSENGYLTPESDEGAVNSLRASAEGMSLAVPTVCAGLMWNYPLTSNDASVAQKGMEIVRKSLKICKWVGANTLLVIPGQVTEEVPYDVAYQRASEALKQLSADAQACGVVMGVENVWNKLLLSPIEMRDFVDGVGSEMVGVYFDVGNVMVNGYPQHWIRVLRERIRKVHVKDFKQSVGNTDGFANLLEGDVNWKEVAAALGEIGYDDLVTAEITGYTSLPELGLKHAREAMKRIFRGNG